MELEYCVVAGAAPKLVSDVCAMTVAAIKNIVAAENVASAVAPKRSVEIPRTPRKAKRTQNPRFVKKVSALDFACA